MPATIKDVARAAGVSVATVSRAMNGHSNVLPDTRERILSVAKSLRFTPSGAARSLIMRRTETIGALLPDLHGEFFSELIRGIDQAARARGLHLLVSSSHGDADEAVAALRAMAGRVDGVLIMAPQADAPALLEHLAPRLPTVLLNSPEPAADERGTAARRLPSFTIDNVDGGRAMTAHLAAQGRCRIAFIGGPAANHEAQARRQGYREALAALARPQVPIEFDGDFTEAAGQAVGRRIAALPVAQRPDAVFAANDMMAIGCLVALAEAGIAVPGEVALGGFDDIPIARYVTPPLSTVHVPIAELGAAALAALADGIEAAQASNDELAETGPAADPDTDTGTAANANANAARAPAPALRQVLPVRLVVRRSSGAAAVPGAGLPAPVSETRRAPRRAVPKP
ncbi:LacI family DNA-binding transcriptional regulator [Aquabacterium sp. OR-4]|uniref:LacI family DNA-binding transcriptional regulator n=1 Tax=Aquabacterium sp. OR-4 TaxID=2978127 RepID=UPI0021B1AC18|nr:LacI family DNA-binding transcriptional regulator [Aquabacterium sp. OR-4]MDT7835930.1 LacI family DNA-binding transcriptional regulator [Aquabacterium sp. OR-4]